MSLQIINNGSFEGDETAESIFQAFEKAKQNFESLNLIKGWGYYKDDSSADQTISTTPSLVTINGLDATSDSDYLPREIRGSSELFDVSTNKITPISIGDTYSCRLDFNVVSKTGTPKYLTLRLDIGDGTPIFILNARIDVDRTPPFPHTVPFPIFSKQTFLANNGSFTLETDTGSCVINNKALFIERINKGDI